MKCTNPTPVHATCNKNTVLNHLILKLKIIHRDQSEERKTINKQIAADKKKDTRKMLQNKAHAYYGITIT
jgi:hypothetical protein